MKRSALLLALALTPFALMATQGYATESWGEGWHPDRPVTDADASRAYIDSFGDPYIPADELAARQRGADRPGPNPPGERHRYPYQAPEPGWRGEPPGEDPRARGPHPGAGPGTRELPANGRSEYRFRGDERFGGESSWGFGPDRDGYRFRPLTDLERERIHRESDWWSGAAMPRADRHQGAGPRSQGGASGYGSDDWFRRHYGDRP